MCILIKKKVREKMKSKNRIAFELTDLARNYIGEHLDTMHIIDIDADYDDEIAYRIYHAGGFCIDVSKEPTDDNELVDSVEDGFIYTYSESWDGFNIAGIDTIIDLLKDTLKGEGIESEESNE